MLYVVEVLWMMLLAIEAYGLPLTSVISQPSYTSSFILSFQVFKYKYACEISQLSGQTQLKLNFMRLSWTVYLHRRRRLYLERLSCYGHYCIRQRICTQRALDGFCSSPTHLSTAQLSSSSGVPKLQ
ncbi:hypothetical protein EV424DRAFT_1064024 [Suillus variegatus]|nr:hypothetical protein EV424DRAFT_1064024 [Suillus variegatus]